MPPEIDPVQTDADGAPAARPWEQDGWVERAQEWVQAQLAGAGLGARGGWRVVQTRPWSSVWQIETAGGRLYFKAAAEALAYEAGLHQALAAAKPGCVPNLIAVDPGRGWILMCPAGTALRSQIRTPADLELWAQALASFADLQRAWVARAGDLLDLGVLDRRLAALPAALSGLLEDEHALGIGQPGGLARQELERLRQSVAEFQSVCDRVTALGVPETLHHDDLHDANVYAQPSGIVFGDWGEACLATPLIAPMIGLRSLAWRLELPDDSPELANLRRAFFAVWIEGGSPAELDAAYRLALPLAGLSRALTWTRALRGIPYRQRGEEADAPAVWLRQALAWLQAVP